MSVGDVADRHFVNGFSGPKVLPHAAGNSAMQLGDTVAIICQAQSQNRHAEDFVRPVGTNFCQVHEFVTIQAERAPEIGKVFVDQPGGEFVISCWHWGVGGENT